MSRVYLLNVCNTHYGEKKPTRQNRCFYLHMSSRGHCKGVFGGGTSFCSLRTQRVCSEKQTRPGTTVRLTELVPTSRHRRLLPRSVRAQHFQNCYHSRWRRCSHHRRLWSLCFPCCCYLCWAPNSPRRRFAVAGCLTSCKNHKLRCVAVQNIRTVLLFAYFSRLAR